MKHKKLALFKSCYYVHLCKAFISKKLAFIPACRRKSVLYRWV